MQPGASRGSRTRRLSTAKPCPPTRALPSARWEAEPRTPSAISKPDKDIPGKENKARVPGEQMRACPVRQNAGGRGAQLPGGAGGTEARHPDCGDGCTAPARVLTGCRPPRERQLSCRLGLQEVFHFPSENSPTPRSESRPSSPAELPPPAQPVSQRTARAPPGSAGWGTAASPHTPQPGPGSPRPRHPEASPLLTELVTQRPPGQDKPPLSTGT